MQQSKEKIIEAEEGATSDPEKKEQPWEQPCDFCRRYGDHHGQFCLKLQAQVFYYSAIRDFQDSNRDKCEKTLEEGAQPLTLSYFIIQTQYFNNTVVRFADNIEIAYNQLMDLHDDGVYRQAELISYLDCHKRFLEKFNEILAFLVQVYGNERMDKHKQKLNDLFEALSKIYMEELTNAEKKVREEVAFSPDTCCCLFETLVSYNAISFLTLKQGIETFYTTTVKKGKKKKSFHDTMCNVFVEQLEKKLFEDDTGVKMAINCWNVFCIAFSFLNKFENQDTVWWKLKLLFTV